MKEKSEGKLRRKKKWKQNNYFAEWEKVEKI